MTRAVRGAPPIPDYEILGYIGGGSYGEVWLGRSLTGTLRAIKVVWREDFDYEKTFEREFQGIREFEPVSRSHKNLVHVYHVGWLAEHGLYYYVMEVADDQVRGWDIDPAGYRPRTLTSDLETVSRIALPICIKGAIKIAGALRHLHDYGLTHRDIKPSNIIFVHGEPKLADIGLVAVAGERSYVGTDGYVPPEGPGTPAADIFSLGKVMYELSTGLDRNEFPSIPGFLKESELGTWRRFNEVLCKACHPNPSRRYVQSGDLSRDLRRVLERIEAKPPYRLKLTAALTVASAVTGWVLSATLPHNNQIARVVAPLPYARSPVAPVRPGPLGVAALSGAQTWLNSLDMSFRKDTEGYKSERPVDIMLFGKYLSSTGRPFSGEIVTIPVPEGSGSDVHAVIVPPGDAKHFADWLTAGERKSGLITEQQVYMVRPLEEYPPGVNAPSPNPGGPANIGFQLALINRPTGSVVIETDPAGAVVYTESGANLGRTPMLLERQIAGDVSFSIELQGFQRVVTRGELLPNRTLVLSKILVPSKAVVFNQTWTNSLGMRFVPLADMMIGAHEAPESAVNVWRAETGQPLPASSTDPSADSRLPAAGISRNDAVRFSEWLTHRERSLGLLEESHEYRLPTDKEWSRMADLPPERGVNPAEKNDNIRGIYPWFFAWPPPAGAGNYADESARGLVPQVLEGYNDHYPRLAPGGAFSANHLSIHDLGGNVREWVSDSFGGGDGGTKDLGVLRGGGWRDSVREHLFSSHRFVAAPDSAEPDSGFRLVLSRVGATLKD